MTLLVLGIAVGYIALERRSKLDTIENTLHEIQKHINTEAMRGIEVFSTADELMARMTEITVGAESVSTLNLSPSRGTSPALDRYFTQVHRYIKKHDSQMKSFRTLASLESISKARWILERCVELAGTGRVSTSLLPPAVGSNTFLMGFHIVFKENQSYVFFYRPIDPAGLMDSFLLKNAEVSAIMLKYFEFLWHISTGVNYGKRIDIKGLEQILKIDPSLAQDKNFVILNDQAKIYL